MIAAYHTPASDAIADAIGPAMLIANVLVFTALKSEVLVRSIQAPGYMNSKLNWSEVSTRK
jgi:hypothetical protein